MTALELAYSILFTAAEGVIGALMLCCILRSAAVSRLTDRVVAVNMTSTMAIAFVCLLCVQLRQGWLADVALVYAMLGVVGTAVLGKVLVRKEDE